MYSPLYGIYMTVYGKDYKRNFVKDYLNRWRIISCYFVEILM